MNPLGRAVAAIIALLGLIGLVGPATGASAADEIATQPYVSLMGLDKVKAQGLDGEGLTIGLIDAKPDLSVPELVGADVTVKDPCQGDYTPRHVAHATATLSVMANRRWGYAPKAKYIVYASPLGKDGRTENLPKRCADQGHGGYLLQQALNDRVDVVVVVKVTVTVSATTPFAMGVIRAMDMGVPVVVGAGNERESMVVKEARYDGVVAAGAGTAKGGLAEFSNYGDGLTVVALAEGLTVRAPDASGKLTKKRRNAYGTSYAAPQVGAGLVLAMQKWPQANGHQIVHSMVNTAIQGPSSKGKWTPKAGWGNFNLRGLIANDPTGYPTTTPLKNKMPDALPSQEFIDLYHAGLMSSYEVKYDKDYIYRGTSEVEAEQFPPEQVKMGTAPTLTPRSSAAPSASPAASPDSSEPAVDDGQQGGFPWLMIGVAAAALLAVGGVITVWLIRRRQVASTRHTPPPGQ